MKVEVRPENPDLHNEYLINGWEMGYVVIVDGERIPDEWSTFDTEAEARMAADIWVNHQLHEKLQLDTSCNCTPAYSTYARPTVPRRKDNSAGAFALGFLLGGG